MTVGEAVADATRQLSEAGVDTARLDAELLVGHALGVSRRELYADRGRVLTRAELDAADALLERRRRREPLAYILGEWGFRRLTLRVDGRVLVPRPETEVVVERCLGLLRDVDRPAVLDVGTGSGAIALAIADELPGAAVTAIDVSGDALEVARANAVACGLDVVFELRDLREGLAGRYDLVVSNPPYVGADEIDGLAPEVRDWEPRVATVGEEHTGLLADAATQILRPGGFLVLEVADGRAERVSAALRTLGYADVRASPDLAGRDRVVEGRWGTSSAR